MSCITQHSTGHHSNVLHALLCSPGLHLPPSHFVSCVPKEVVQLFAHCNRWSMEPFLLARRPSVASHKTGKALLCKQDQQPYTASWTTTIGREAICGVSQDGQSTAVKAALTSPYPAAGTVHLCGLRRHLSQTAEPASAAQPARQLCAHPICHPHIPQVNGHSN